MGKRLVGEHLVAGALLVGSGLGLWKLWSCSQSLDWELEEIMAKYTWDHHNAQMWSDFVVRLQCGYSQPRGQPTLNDRIMRNSCLFIHQDTRLGGVMRELNAKFLIFCSLHSYYSLLPQNVRWYQKNWTKQWCLGSLSLIPICRHGCGQL